MGIARQKGKLVGFNSEKMQSPLDYFGLSEAGRTATLICTTLNYVKFPHDVWLTAFIDWLGLRRNVAEVISMIQNELLFEIWRNFETPEQRLVCRAADTNNAVASTASRTTTAVTCVDKDVPPGHHTYCLTVTIPASEEQAVYGIRAFRGEITAAELKV